MSVGSGIAVAAMWMMAAFAFISYHTTDYGMWWAVMGALGGTLLVVGLEVWLSLEVADDTEDGIEK